ncbi:hypothetical protein D3C83_132950 [compost metagenome]
MISLACIGTCVARACPDVQALVDAFVNCAIMQFGTCGDIMCIMDECREEFTACLGARCP